MDKGKGRTLSCESETSSYCAFPHNAIVFCEVYWISLQHMFNGHQICRIRRSPCHLWHYLFSTATAFVLTSASLTQWTVTGCMAESKNKTPFQHRADITAATAVLQSVPLSMSGMLVSFILRRLSGNSEAANCCAGVV